MRDLIESLLMVLIVVVAAPIFGLKRLIEQARARPVLRLYDESEVTDLTLTSNNLCFRRERGRREKGPLEQIDLSEIATGKWTEIEHIGSFADGNDARILIELQLHSGRHIAVGAPSSYAVQTKQEIVEPLILHGALSRAPAQVTAGGSFANAGLLFMNIIWAGVAAIIWLWRR